MNVKMNEFPEYLKRLNAALALREIPDYPAALDQLKKSVEVDSKDASVYLLLGLTYQDLDQLEEAETSLRQSLSINPQSKEAIQALGLLLAKKGESQKAIEFLRPLSQSEPDNLSITQALASALRKERQTVEAAEILSAAHNRVPENLEIALQLSEVLQKEHKPEQALDVIQRTNSLNPSAELFCRVGSIYRKLEDPEKARASLEKALEIDRQHAESWYQLSNLLLEQGELSNALQIVDAGINSVPESFRLLQIKAEILFLKHQEEECLKTYAQAIELAGNEKQIIDRAILTFLRDNKLFTIAGYRAAIKQIDKDIAETDHFAPLVHLKLKILSSKGKHSQILQTLEDFDYTDPRINAINLFSPYHYRALIGIGDYNEASSLIEKSLATLPDEDERSKYILLVGNIGVEFYETGEIEKSRGCFEQIIKIDPDNDRAYNNLAFLHICNRHWEPALQLLQQAEELSYSEKATLLTNRAYIFICQEKYAEAISTLQKALEETDEDDLAILHVAYPWQRGLFQNQADDYPTRNLMVYCAIYANLATAYWMLQDYDMAWQTVKKVLVVDSEDPIGYRLMGCLHLALGETKQARDLWEKALKLKPSKAEAEIIKGWIKSFPADHSTSPNGNNIKRII
jgi:tetratricopeptide (TPR) repeat protein